MRRQESLHLLVGLDADQSPVLLPMPGRRMNDPRFGPDAIPDFSSTERERRLLQRLHDVEQICVVKELEIDRLAAWLTTLANDRESWNEYIGRTEDDDLDEARAAVAAVRAPREPAT